jgi:hypothetical protein
MHTYPLHPRSRLQDVALSLPPAVAALARETLQPGLFRACKTVWRNSAADPTISMFQHEVGGLCTACGGIVCPSF